MFGMGGTEIIVILIVALLFLGPDKLPEAAKQISKGIRDLKKQSRVLQRTIEDDEHIGGAIRDLKSALRGEDEPLRPKPIKPATALTEAGATPALTEAGAAPALTEAGAATALTEAGATTALVTASDGLEPAALAPPDPEALAPADPMAASSEAASGEPATASTTASASAFTLPARITLPDTAGEPDDAAPPPAADHDAQLAALVKPAANTIARAAAATDEPSHG
jgi:sec-independent protein translocase protein TatB